MTTEEAALDNLHVSAYPWKFNQAKKMAEGKEDYWGSVRQYYLELGGGLETDKCFCGDEPRKLSNVEAMKASISYTLANLPERMHGINPRRG